MKNKGENKLLIVQRLLINFIVAMNPINRKYNVCTVIHAYKYIAMSSLSVV